MIAAAMTISAAGLAFVAHWEGERLHPYQDAAGKWTVGVGHLIRDGEDYSAGITHEKALEILSTDIHTAEAAVNEHVAVELTQNEFDALVSFVFNCGAAAFAGSAILHLLNNGQHQSAANALLMWDHRKDPRHNELVVDAGLLARRKAERDLFLTPDEGPELALNAQFAIDQDPDETKG
jgi:GH24 family phage-related lysozyme (muramidase)